MQSMRAASYCNLLNRAIILCGLLVLSACSGNAPRYFDNKERWAVYYGQEAEPDSFSPFRVVVLDSAAHPDIKEVKKYAGPVLGYVSIGEVDATHDAANAPAVLIEKNTAWNSQMVDIRQPEWQKYILETKVPGVLSQGFDGVMLDTIDSALYLENKDPTRFKGMKDAAVYLVKALRHRYPDMPIMVNRGFGIWPEIANDVTMILAESTLTHMEPGVSKNARWQSDGAYQQYLEKLVEAKGYNKNLRVYTLDYWDMNDTKGVLRIYDLQRKQGFVPYVTTPDLTTIHHEKQASIIAPTGEEGILYA